MTPRITSKKRIDFQELIEKVAQAEIARRKQSVKDAKQLKKTEAKT